MFLERVGKLCFFQIRPSLFYFLVLLPPLLSSLYLFFESTEMRDMEQGFNQSMTKGRLALKRKALQERFLERYGNSNPYFLDQYIEAMPLLSEEKKKIETLMTHPAATRLDIFRERLKFIASGENRISFAEENTQSTKSMKETEEKQRYPVQIDEKDLSQLLSLIEDVEIGECKPAENSPQLLIKNFHLQRTRTLIDTDVFTLEMSLLKREFSL